MPMEMKLWEIDEDRLSAIDESELDDEARLEDWIDRDVEVLGAELLLIGRQVTTDLGGRLDLLAIDPAGQLVIIELKKDRTPREVVAQALEYAAWVATLTYDEVAEIAQDYLQASLPKAFKEAFEEELPEAINDSQSMIVVASQLDVHSESILRYLSEQWGVDVNAVFFRCFESHTDGKRFLGRSWLMEPSEVQARKAKAGRWTSSTIEELEKMAEEHGAGDEFRRLLELGRQHDLRLWHAQYKLTWRGHFGGAQYRKLFGIYPSQGEEGKLYTEILLSNVSEYFEMDEEEIRSALPDTIPGQENYYLLSTDDIERLSDALKGH